MNRNLKPRRYGLDSRMSGIHRLEAHALEDGSIVCYMQNPTFKLRERVFVPHRRPVSAAEETLVLPTIGYALGL